MGVARVVPCGTEYRGRRADETAVLLLQSAAGIGPRAEPETREMTKKVNMDVARECGGLEAVAQAAGDFAALCAAGRRVLWTHLRA